MSKNSLVLVLQNKQENSAIDTAKVQIKSEKLTPFGGIFLGHGAMLAWNHPMVLRRQNEWEML